MALERPLVDLVVAALPGQVAQRQRPPDARQAGKLRSAARGGLCMSKPSASVLAKRGVLAAIAAQPRQALLQHKAPPP